MRSTRTASTALSEQPVDLSKVDVSDPDEWRALDLEDKIAYLKATVSVHDVLSLFGIEPNSQGKIISPWNPEERTPSCHCWEDHVYCFSTGKGGDIFDVVMAITGETEITRAVWSIKNRAVRAGLEYGQVEQRKPRQVHDFTAQLEGAGAPLVRLRLGDFTYDVSDCGLRQDPEGNVLVPHRRDGVTYAVKVRYRSGGKGAWAGSVPTAHLYAPSGAIDPNPELVAVLCEGESDCWAMADALRRSGQRAQVLGLPSGAAAWKDHWLDELRVYRKVYVCMDNDRAGRQAADKIVRKIGWAKATELRVPQLRSDVREAVETGWIPDLP